MLLSHQRQLGCEPETLRVTAATWRGGDSRGLYMARDHFILLQYKMRPTDLEDIRALSQIIRNAIQEGLKEVGRWG